MEQSSRPLSVGKSKSHISSNSIILSTPGNTFLKTDSHPPSLCVPPPPFASLFQTNVDGHLKCAHNASAPGQELSTTSTTTTNNPDTNLPFLQTKSSSTFTQQHINQNGGGAAILFYSLRPKSPGDSSPIPALTGPSLYTTSSSTTTDDTSTVSSSNVSPDAAIDTSVFSQLEGFTVLGATDSIAAGLVSGWACLRPQQQQQQQQQQKSTTRQKATPIKAPIQILLYVDGHQVASVPANQPTRNAPEGAVVGALCGDGSSGNGGGGGGFGFTAELPPLSPGVHELRSFATWPQQQGGSDDTKSGRGGSGNKDDEDEDNRMMWKVELHQSPLTFSEIDQSMSLEAELARKDALLQLKSAQLSVLMQQLQSNDPWHSLEHHQKHILPPFTALNQDKNGDIKSSGGGGTVAKREKVLDSASLGSSSIEGATGVVSNVVFIAINTGPTAGERRARLRRTWVPSTPQGLKDLEAKHGIVLRFAIGKTSDTKIEQQLKEEIDKYGDIIRLDVDDVYENLSAKTIRLFSDLPEKYIADYYMKVDDDIAINLPELSAYLKTRGKQPNLYFGCMTSGQVLGEGSKWHEPEKWRFGGAASYPRYASGQIYGVSRAVALYIGANQRLLHRYANEDVSVGVWLLGLDVEYLDEKRLCCDSLLKCASQTNAETVCLAYNEYWCAGICSSETRLEPIYQKCLMNPYVTSPLLKKSMEAKAKQQAEDAAVKKQAAGERLTPTKVVVADTTSARAAGNSNGDATAI